MVISFKHRFMFFRNPKAGSTTTEIILRMCDTLGPDDIASALLSVGLYGVNARTAITDREHLYLEAHMTPAQALKEGYFTEQQLEDFDCYMILREPKARLMSSLKHSFKPAFPNIFEQIVTGELDDKLNMVWDPQSIYIIPGITPLLFDDFKDNINFMCGKLGHPGFPVIPNFNRAGGELAKGEVYWTPQAEEWYVNRYAEDIALYNSLMEDRTSVAA